MRGVDSSKSAMEDVTASQLKFLGARHALWRVHAPLLYSVVATTCLDKASVTVEWIPESPRVGADDGLLYTLAVGSVGSRFPNLSLFDVLIPQHSGPPPAALGCPDPSGMPTYAPSPRFLLTHRIPMLDDVHCIRAAPFNSRKLAIRMRHAAIAIVNLDAVPLTTTSLVWWGGGTRHRFGKPVASKCTPVLQLPPGAVTYLHGHSSGGKAVSWSRFSQPAVIASGDNEGCVGIWDVAAIGCLGLPKLHAGRVTGVTFGPDVSQWSTVTASCSDDGSVVLHDLRAPLMAPPRLRIPSSACIARFQPHSGGAVACMEWSPAAMNLLFTSASNGSASLWDLRNLQSNVVEVEKRESSNGPVCATNWPETMHFLPPVGFEERLASFQVPAQLDDPMVQVVAPTAIAQTSQALPTKQKRARGRPPKATRSLNNVKGKESPIALASPPSLHFVARGVRSRHAAPHPEPVFECVALDKPPQIASMADLLGLDSSIGTNSILSPQKCDVDSPSVACPAVVAAPAKEAPASTPTVRVSVEIASGDSTVKIESQEWEIFGSVELVANLGSLHVGGISSMELHPTLPLLATAGEDRCVRIWDLRRDLCAPSGDGSAAADKGDGDVDGSQLTCPVCDTPRAALRHEQMGCVDSSAALVFTHNGHNAPVFAARWLSANPVPGFIASRLACCADGLAEMCTWPYCASTLAKSVRCPRHSLGLHPVSIASVSADATLEVWTPSIAPYLGPLS